MTYNPAHILASTFLLAVLIVFGFAHLAHADTVLYDKTYTGGDIIQAGGAQTDFTSNDPDDWDWGGFLFSSSTDGRITNIEATISSVEGDARARWLVYEVSGVATTTLGTLVGRTWWETATNTTTNIFTFEVPITLKWSRDYQFILETEPGERIVMYSWLKNGVPPSETYSIGCPDTQEINDCEFYPIPFSGAYSGYGWPFVKLYDAGSLAEEEYIGTYAPCATDSRDKPTTACSQPFEEIPDFGWYVNTTEPNRQVSIEVRTLSGELVDSVGYFYTEPGFYTATTSFVIVSTTTKVVVNVQTCLLPEGVFIGWGDGGECTTQIFGNGTSTASYIETWCQQNYPLCEEAGVLATSSPRLCDTEACSFGNVLNQSIASSTMCALSCAFEPSSIVLDKWKRASNLVTYSYPVGYFTYIYKDITTALESTSTDIFTREIELGKYFGRPNTATTTLTLTGTETYIEKIKPVTDKVNVLLWIGFAVWFIIWAVTRKL